MPIASTTESGGGLIYLLVEDNMDTKKLIEEVLLDLGNNKTLSEVASKIQIIVRLLGDDDLKKWYTCEFVTGYDNEELPEYRKTMAADIKATYLVPHGFGMMHFSGQSVPVVNLGMEKYKEIMTIFLKDTISAIIHYSNHPDDVAMSLSPYEKMQVQKVLGEAQIQTVHKVIPPSAFQTIIDNVQSKIIDMFMDLDQNVFNGEIEPSSAKAQHEIKQVINNNIVAGIIQTGTGSIDANNASINVNKSLSVEVKNYLHNILDELEKFLQPIVTDESKELIDEIKKEITSESPKPKFLKRCFQALKGVASDVATTIASSQVIELIDQALAIL